MRAAGVCAFILICTAGLVFAQYPQYPQQTQEPKKDQSKEPKVSDAENQALKKIVDAPDAATKLQAATEFVKKYPKSAKRSEVARHLAGEITRVQDTAQQITLGEGYLASFNLPEEAALVNQHLIDAYVKANRLDDAFRIAATMLEKNPNDVIVLTQMSIVASEELKRNNPKYIQQSQT
jgi:pentatricopeptide repeat protein